MRKYTTKIKRMQALGCAALAGAILGGAVIASAPKTAQAVEAKTVRASESGYCVIPAREIARDAEDESRPMVGPTEEEPEQEAELVMIERDLRVEIALIKGCVPSAAAETSSVTVETVTPSPEGKAWAAQEAPKAYTEEELELLACVIYCEAGGDEASDETRRMVGEVVLNRVADPRFPSSILGVLTQKRQYGLFWRTGVVWPGRASREPEAVERAYACAELVLSGERLLPEDVVFQAEFVQGEIVASAPGFYFCR